MKSQYEKLREGLIKTRYRKDLSVRDLAEIMGVAKSSLNNWESGRNIPDAVNLLIWCDALGYELTIRRKESNGRPLPHRATSHRV